ncbi:MAG: hypothetical protein R8K49_02410 [Mariprofundaceae bacterium]
MEQSKHDEIQENINRLMAETKALSKPQWLDMLIAVVITWALIKFF